MGVIAVKYADRKPEFPLVVLEPGEIAFCKEMGFRRSKSYTREGYGTQRGDDLPGVHTAGILAEAAVAKYYGVEIDERIIDGGDEGADLEIDGKQIDVKGNRRRRRELLVKQHKTEADVYVLTDIESESHIRLIGWTDRQTLTDRQPQYYPTDILNYVMHWSDLNEMPEPR